VSGFYGRVEALLVPGEWEGLVGGGLGQLVTVRLSDGGSSDRPARAALRPGEARELAFALIELAEQAERETRR